MTPPNSRMTSSRACFSSMSANLTQEKLAMQEILAVTQKKFVFSLCNMETIHQRIARLRAKKDLSMAELAEKIGVSWQTVQQWENGKTAPQRRRMKSVAEALGVSEYDLVVTDVTKTSQYFETKSSSSAAITMEQPVAPYRRHQDQSREISEVINLMEQMDDVGRGMVLQETRAIARERTSAGKANSA